MTALTAATAATLNLITESVGLNYTQAIQQANTGVAFHSGAAIELDMVGGVVAPLSTTTTGACFAGFCTEAVTTVTGATERVAVDVSGKILNSVSVTGVTAQTDVTSLVYLTTDNIGDDLTLTRAAADSIAIGTVVHWITSTTCDVKTFTLDEAKRHQLGGDNRKLVHIGSYPLNAITAADVATNVVTFVTSGTIISWYLIVEEPTGDAAAAATFNLEINTTNLTGGTITITDTAGSDDIDVQGARFDASAITAANVFHAGDTLSIEAASVTDYTDGQVGMYMLVESAV